MTSRTRFAITAVALVLGTLGIVLTGPASNRMAVLLTFLGVIVALVPQGPHRPSRRRRRLDQDQLRAILPLLQLAPFLTKDGKKRFEDDPDRLAAAATLIGEVSTTIGGLHPATRFAVSEMQWRQLRARTVEPLLTPDDKRCAWEILEKDLDRLRGTIEAYLRDGR